MPSNGSQVNVKGQGEDCHLALNNSASPPQRLLQWQFVKLSMEQPIKYLRDGSLCRGTVGRSWRRWLPPLPSPKNIEQGAEASPVINHSINQQIICNAISRLYKMFARSVNFRQRKLILWVSGYLGILGMVSWGGFWRRATLLTANQVGGSIRKPRKQQNQSICLEGPKDIQMRRWKGWENVSYLLICILIFHLMFNLILMLLKVLLKSVA